MIFTGCSGYQKWIAITEILIDSGADINVKSKNGETAIFEAIRMNAEGIVSLLITSGADLSIKSQYTETVLNLAVYNYNPKILNLICNALSRIDVNDESTRNALFAALETGYIEAIKQLLRKE